jgi:hypothetical protein
MRRSPEDAVQALRTQVMDWGRNEVKPDLRILAYPPEWEAGMIRRIRALAAELEHANLPVDVVDAGAELVANVVARSGLRDRLEQSDLKDPEKAYDDLSYLATTALVKVLKRPLPDGHVARVVVNTGGLATLVSYSQITSEFVGTDSALGGATVLAFPGDADERSLNLLHLRIDTSYRAPRI